MATKVKYANKELADVISCRFPRFLQRDSRRFANCASERSGKDKAEAEGNEVTQSQRKGGNWRVATPGLQAPKTQKKQASANPLPSSG